VRYGLGALPSDLSVAAAVTGQSLNRGLAVVQSAAAVVSVLVGVTSCQSVGDVWAVFSTFRDV